MAEREHPARIWIEQDTIHYTVEDSEIWGLPISQLRVIGEYTTPDGPYADDYFFVFLSDSFWYEASFYSQGGVTLFSELSELLGEEIACGLQNSTDWKSRIVWPADLREKPLFEIVPAAKPPGIWNAVKYKFLSPVELHLTREAKDRMKSNDENHA